MNHQNLLLTDDDCSPLSPEQCDLDVLCERWVIWSRTRRLYGPAPSFGSILGQLSSTSARPLKVGGPDAISSAELAAFHLAYICQPDALDKKVFALYYVHRVHPIKTAAAALGISRAHFYRVLSDFRKRLHGSAAAILAQEQHNLEALPHYSAVH